MIQTYYTPLDSDTGRALKDLADRITAAQVIETAFIRLYGLKAMLPAAENIVGGITIAEFLQRPSTNLWLPFMLRTGVPAKNCYRPNAFTLVGQSLITEVNRIPVVRKNELLKLLNLPLGSYQVPKVDIHDEKSFIRYTFDPKWYSTGTVKYVMPGDCVKSI